MTGSESDARRLEQLWAGDFGDEYVARNLAAYEHRRPFWDDLLSRLACDSIVEVGSNVGGNLRWVAPHAPGFVVGIDVNRGALDALRTIVPASRPVQAAARALPLRDRSVDLVFTMGVLIHQPDESLATVMREMVRISRRYLLCGEYYGEESSEVPYRGERGALFRRDYGRAFREVSPDLHEVDTGFLGRDAGWDDVTWWLFERR